MVFWQVSDCNWTCFTVKSWLQICYRTQCNGVLAVQLVTKPVSQWNHDCRFVTELGAMMFWQLSAYVWTCFTVKSWLQICYRTQCNGVLAVQLVTEPVSQWNRDCRFVTELGAMMFWQLSACVWTCFTVKSWLQICYRTRCNGVLADISRFLLRQQSESNTSGRRWMGVGVALATAAV